MTTTSTTFTTTVTTKATSNFYLGYNIANILRYRFYESIYSSLSVNLAIGVNVYPFGTRSFRNILGFLIFILSIFDLILAVTISTFFTCVGPGKFFFQ